MQNETGVGSSSKRRARLVTGIVGLLFSAGYGYMAGRLPMGTSGQPGAGVVPLGVAGVTAVASILLILEQLARQPGESDEPLGLPDGMGRRRVIGFVLAVAVYTVVAGYLGNLVAGFIMCLVMVHLVDPRSWRRTIITAAAIAVATQVLFVLILAVPLPEGTLLK